MKLRILLAENVIKQAVERFGITNSTKKAAYILPNGKLLDFSVGRSYRILDHSEISQATKLKISKFMKKTGSIRISHAGDDMSLTIPPKKPTENQMAAIQSALPLDNLYVDVWGEKYSEDSHYKGRQVRTLAGLRKFLNDYFD